jgi:hypothetical protein
MTVSNAAQDGHTIDQSYDDIAAQLRRQRVSRRTLLKGALTGVGAIALANYPLMKRAFAAAGGTTGTSGAVIVGRHVAFPNEGGHDPTNSMRVTAQVLFPSGVLGLGLSPVLRYGTSSSYGATATATVVNLTGVVPNAPGGALAGNQFYIKALATSLQPATTYHYRLELGDGTVTGDGTFTTAPDRRALGSSPTPGVQLPPAFTFTSFGDHGTNTAPTDPPFAYSSNMPFTWPNASFDDNYYVVPGDPVLGYDLTPAITMTALVAAQSPSFHLVNGDICYADPSGTGLPVDDTSAPGTHGGAPAGFNAYDPYVWDVYFQQIEVSASSTPWMVSTGNHDMEAIYGTHGYGGHLDRLDLPQNGPSVCPSVYSFVYGNVGVISVDANDLSFEIPTNLNYSAGAQAAWLASTLAAWRSDSSIDFIVMFMHHCAFSTSTAHASDLGVRSTIASLADIYHVDLVLSGHNHQVERTDPIRNGAGVASEPDGSTFDANLGTTYLTVGSAGRPRYGWYNGGTVDTTGASDRYRRHTTGAGAVTSFPNSRTIPGVGVTGTEPITWSQTRYLDYALARIDVVPAAAGKTTTMTITIVADGDRVANKGGVIIDQITLQRVAAAEVSPPSDVSEAPLGILLPVTAAAAVGVAAVVHHARKRDGERRRG